MLESSCPYKPHGTGIEYDFVRSLQLLGRRGLTFDLGVDQHRRGKQQLEDALVMIQLAHKDVPDDEKVTVIVNHLCKPDLTVINTADPSFQHWRNAMYSLSKCDKTYMKLSGGFAEMAPSLSSQPPDAIFEALFAWLGIVLATFGPRRHHWKLLVERMCYMATMDPEDQAELFAGTALRAYGIELSKDA
ncbi:L-rhamnono-gamma-lactonase like protein [Verticillium longisporum]|nr:L-rhamnono-gamma-lactonase like protein [Verticillium longisporum]